MGKKNKKSKQGKNATTRHYIRVVAFVVFGISLGALLMLRAYPYLLVSRPHVEGSDAEKVTNEPVSLSRELPTRLRIPRLGVDASFETPLELDSDGTITVPEAYDAVGWYKGGAAPGEKGTASILGHVDSREGPAVFFSLGQLVAGDRIFVERADGTTAEFEVEYFERYKQSEFPTEKVYGMTEYPSLRLITCSGTYDKGTLRYTHNTVVYARLVPPQP